LLDAYQAEVIELTELAERRERLTEQGQQLRARVQEIEQQRLERAAEMRLLEGVDAFCTSIRDAMVAPSFEVKQKVLQLVVQRIVVEDHRITIEHVVPSGPIRLQPEHHAPAGPSCGLLCLRRQLDVLQVGEVAGDHPREHILCNILGVHRRFRKQPEQRYLGELGELMVPDLP
jgi:hypothetical protein